MKNRITSKAFVIPVLAAVVLLMTGCGAAFPEMSDSEYNAVVNYAAGLLMRYAKDTTDRLTFLDTTYTPEHLTGAGTQELIAQQTAPDSAQTQQTPPATQPATETPAPDTQTDPAGDGQTQQAETPADPAQTGQEQTDQQNPGTGETEPGGGPADLEPADEPMSDLPVQEPGPEQQMPAETPVSNGVPIANSSLQSLAGGASIEYTGYSVRNAYPDSQTQGAVAAAYGDKLLVVDFTIHNMTGAPVRFNTASLNPQFKLQINGEVQGFTMVTMIANDLGGMDTEIAPGAHVDAVLLMEVPESLAKSVNTLDLIVVRGAEAQTIRLE